MRYTILLLALVASIPFLLESPHAMAAALPEEEWRHVGGDPCKADPRCTAEWAASQLREPDGTRWPAPVIERFAEKMSQRITDGRSEVCPGDRFGIVTDGGGVGHPQAKQNVRATFTRCYEADLYVVIYERRRYEVRHVDACGNHASAPSTALPTPAYPVGSADFYCPGEPHIEIRDTPASTPTS